MYMVTLDDLGNIGSFVGGIASMLGLGAIVIGYFQLKHQIEESRKANMPEVEIEVVPDGAGIKVILINPKDTPVFLKEYFLVFSFGPKKGALKLNRDAVINDIVIDSGWEMKNRVLGMGDTYDIKLTHRCFMKIRASEGSNHELELVLNIHGMPKEILRFSISHGLIYLNSEPVSVYSMNEFLDAVNNGEIELDEEKLSELMLTDQKVYISG